MKTEQVVLITGAASGIGLATAELLRAQGYRVFGASRSPEQYEVRTFPLMALDVHSDESVRACVRNVLEQAGRIDVLINNAGTGLSGAVEETMLPEAQSVFETNFFGIVRMTQSVLPTMRQQGSGKIIMMSSSGGLLGVPFRAFYVASKFALEGYSESLRYEVRPFGITVSLVEPSFVSTPAANAVPHTRDELEAYAALRSRLAEEFKASMRQGMPPVRVARVIQQIIEHRSPRLRYTVSAQATMLALLRRLLPQRGFELLVRRMFGMEGRSLSHRQ